MSEYLSTIDLSDIPAAIAKVQGHTGRELGAIVADFACCTVHQQDLRAERKRLSDAGTADAKRVAQEAAALWMLAEPGALIKVAGVVIRRSHHVAGRQKLLNAREARAKQEAAELELLRAKAEALQPLIDELCTEAERAGLPRNEMQAWLASGTVTCSSNRLCCCWLPEWWAPTLRCTSIPN